ncbi:MAG: hypothetical protein AAGK09_07445 [Planctomycetota bacterium]
MDPATFKFLVFTVFNAATLVAGYVAFHRGWLSQAFSRRLHVFTVVVLWAAMSFLCVWSVPLSWSSLWLAVFPTVLIPVGVVSALGVGWILRLPRMSLAVAMVSAGLSNTGFTLGSYLCYCLLDDGHGAGAAALAMGVAMVTVMQVSAIAMLYPLASHFGTAEDRRDVWRRVLLSFWDVRAMPLYAGAAGLTLNVLGGSSVPMLAAPSGLLDTGWVQALIYAGAFGAMFGVGMNMHPWEALRAWRDQVTLAVVKFAVFPLATLGLLWLTMLTWLPAEGLMAEMLWIEAFMPTGLIGVMIANMFHLDARLSANLWLVNTVAFLVVPLPVLIWVYG